jgi:hypothetical protein
MTQTVMDITIKLGVLNVPLDPHDNGLDDGNLANHVLYILLNTI